MNWNEGEYVEGKGYKLPDAPELNFISREEFEKMTYKERVELYNRSPQEYNRLKKGI